MKYSLLFMFLFLTNCNYSVCKSSFRDYKYHDNVRVIAGFYKGQTGKIISQSWIYEPDMCNTPAFKILLDIDGSIVLVSQYALEIFNEI